MEQIKTQGLILKTINLNDNDRIFTILTKNHGKITVMAKGIRSQKHKCFSAMQLFCYSEFVFERRTGMYYPVDARVIENFYNLRSSVEKLALAAYIADIVNAIPDEFPVEDDYFSFILNTLFLITKAEISQNFTELIRLKAIFELKTVCENGYMPDVVKCEICASTKNIELFDVTNGRVVCDNCREKYINGDTIDIDAQVQKAMYGICHADMRAALSVKPSAYTLKKLSKIGENYMKNKMDIFLTSCDYFKGLINLSV